MSTTPPPLSFDRAHYEGDPAPPDACAFCHRTLTGDYFRVANHLACSPCASNAASLVPPDSHKAYTKALLFGAIAALLGCAIYALLQATLPFTIGYFAIGVGWVIGRAMKQGSGGLGGRRYQITAALLTYAAISVSFIPVYIYEHRNDAPNHAQHASAADPDTQSEAAAAPTPEPTHKGIGTAILAIFLLIGVGLISPFLLLTASVVHGLFNLFFLYLGIRFAWQFTANPRPDVQGPFTKA